MNELIEKIESLINIYDKFILDDDNEILILNWENIKNVIEQIPYYNNYYQIYFPFDAAVSETKTQVRG